MERTIEIARGVEVHAQSTVSIPVTTRDVDGQGYLRQDGSNRRLAAGIGTDGVIYMYVTDGGGNTMITDDVARTIDICRDMSDDGDADAADDARLRQGLARLRDGVAHLRTIWASQAASEALDWYGEHFAAVEAEIDRVGGTV
jgi:hypothetical protein